jgi:fluoride ion exporter CrcB/FEX
LAFGTNIRSVGLAFAGGAVGSVLRALVGDAFDSLTTLIVVNLLGAAFLGWVNGSALGPKQRFASAQSKVFWGAGFAGGFTTMSGLALATVMLSMFATPVLAVGYVAAQFVLGLGAYLLAYRLSRGAWPNA